MLRFLLGVLEDALRHGPVYLIPACLSCRECGVSFSTNIKIMNEHQDINLFSGYAGSDPVNWKIGVCRHTSGSWEELSLFGGVTVGVHRHCLSQANLRFQLSAGNKGSYNQPWQL